MLRGTLAGSCLIALLTACAGLPSTEDHASAADPLETEEHDSSVDLLEHDSSVELLETEEHDSSADLLETEGTDSAALIGTCNPVTYRYSAQCWSHCEPYPGYVCQDARKAYKCKINTYDVYKNEKYETIHLWTGEVGLTSVKCTWFPENLDTCPEFCGGVAASG